MESDSRQSSPQVGTVIENEQDSIQTTEKIPTEYDLFIKDIAKECRVEKRKTRAESLRNIAVFKSKVKDAMTTNDFFYDDGKHKIRIECQGIQESTYFENAVAKYMNKEVGWPKKQIEFVHDTAANTCVVILKF